MFNPESESTIETDNEGPLTADVRELPRKKTTNRLISAIHAAREQLRRLQQKDGHWCFELEADCTITAEYILMMHFMDEVDQGLQAKFAGYIRRHQDANGGWPLYTGGKFDISCTVKAYYALKFAGDSPNAPHMRRARDLILAHGGAARCNVFTRITLATFQQVPWRAVPFIPAEVMILPRWFPFGIYNLSYWSRTVLVPLTILYSLKAKATNKLGIGIEELFTVPAREEHNYFPTRSKLNILFLYLERFALLFEPLVPNALRNFAIKRAFTWIIPRLNGEDGLGGIFPAMVNAYEALAVAGYKADHPHRISARKALQKLIIDKEHEAYCQPCLSPIWDTALASLAMYEANERQTSKAIYRAMDWLVERQIQHTPDGDWRVKSPKHTGGGWAFQYRNDYYPDTDDTAAVCWAMQEIDIERYGKVIDSAAQWLASMQSRNGGFGAFDKNNTFYILNEIPFADHGALLDPPTSDVSARCITVFGHPRYIGNERFAKIRARCLRYLCKQQEKTGAWYGRWGTNYIYGTWSVLSGLIQGGEPSDIQAIKEAVAWLKHKQRADGGWGESNDTYFAPDTAGEDHSSTCFQTAWALLALMAAGEVHSKTVERGIQFLLNAQAKDGLWHDPGFTAPGFPRVFYLKYHGYDKLFPLWALARYNNLRFSSVK